MSEVCKGSFQQFMSEAQLNSEGEKLKEKVSSGISAQVVVGLLLQKKISQEKKERSF